MITGSNGSSSTRSPYRDASIDDASIDTACPDDLAAILELEETAFAPFERWSRASWESELTGDAMCVLMGRGHDQIGTSRAAGVLALRVLGEQADLDRVLVAPSARRRGIGRRLVAAGMTEAFRSGATEMILEVGQHNVAAIALYESLGFDRSGSRHDYYGPGADATIMKRDLP